MSNPFFDHPILNSPYEYPTRHWELDESGQPTQQIIERRRPAEFITPIPKPKKRRGAAAQEQLVLDEGEGLSTQEQQYHTAIINAVRDHVGQWRNLPNSNDWKVTPETARLLEHWRHHRFSSIRPFFCQVEAAETAIWLTEVAPHVGKDGRAFLDHLTNANRDANPEILRLALKLATATSTTTATSFPAPGRCSSTASSSNPATPSTRASAPWPPTRSTASAARSSSAPATAAATSTG